MNHHIVIDPEIVYTTSKNYNGTVLCLLPAIASCFIVTFVFFYNLV